MIKRPLDPRFASKVRDGIKTTTIRDKPWPIGKPIMLYHWSGAAYRSKHIDVIAIEVVETHPIRISRTENGISFSPGVIRGRLLWSCEGFESPAELQAWFAKIIKVGETVEKSLMVFKTLT